MKNQELRITRVALRAAWAQRSCAHICIVYRFLFIVLLPPLSTEKNTHRLERNIDIEKQ